MSGQDWTPVTISKTGVRVGGAGGGAGGGAAGGGAPRPKASAAGTGARKLEEDTDTFAHATVGLDLRMAIQQARLAKKLSQKDLAAAISEKAQVVNQYEAGTALPNPVIISKLERVLGVRLPRPPKK